MKNNEIKRTIQVILHQVKCLGGTKVTPNGTAIGCVNVTWLSSRPGNCHVRPVKQSRCKPGMAQFLHKPGEPYNCHLSS